MTAAEEQLVAELAEALRYEHGSSHEDLALDDEMWTDLAAALLPVVRRAQAEALRDAADSYESEDEQAAINRLADEEYRPGDCLSSLWLRARADAVEGGNE